MIKKIYNIIGRSSDCIGGIEEFSKNMYKSFPNYEFIEIYNVKKTMELKIETINKTHINSFNFSEIKENSILIIHSISFIKKIPSNILKKSQVVFIDHFFYNWWRTYILYIFIFIYSNKIRCINKALFFPSNKILKNKVQKHKYHFPKWINETLKSEIHNGKILFYCNLMNSGKNLRKILRNWNACMPPLEIYGIINASLLKKIGKTKNAKYMGIIKNSNKSEIISKYKFNFLFSKYEGMPTTIFETLSYNVPTISRITNKNFEKIIIDEYVIKKIKEIPYVFNIPININKMESIKKNYTHKKWINNVKWILH